MSALLETRGLTVRFGGLVALDAVDVAVDGGETLGVIGPNGSGKTTFFNVLTGLYAAAAGDIRFEGRNLVGLDAHVISRLGLARTFHAGPLRPGPSGFVHGAVGL